MDGKIINLQWREDYHYGLYNHRLISKDGLVYTRSFIIIKNRFGVIVRFTNLHNYVGVYENKVFIPIMSDAKAKLHYICMMLNYILIKHYNKFHIDHVFKVNREALECFFRDYATEKLPNGKYRGEQSVEKCVYTITGFFRKLRQKFGGHLLLAESDLYTETKIYSRYGKFQKTKKIPAFQVRGIPKTAEAFRELPTNAFKILIDLAFRYAPDIVFALCLQAFAGLRAGEVCNVRQEGSPIGNGLLFTRVEDRTIKVEIDLTREMSMRSDLLSVDPELSSQWDYEKNAPLKPDEVVANSEKKVWWKCAQDHSWKTVIGLRRRGSDCPYCVGKLVIPGKTDLKTIRPEIAAEWDCKKNGTTTPDKVLPYCNTKFWWVCEHGHSYGASVGNRSLGKGCPYCAGKYPIIGENDLVTINPKWIQEWDYEKNGRKKPENYTACSNARIWWKCRNEHSWRTQIRDRNLGNQCPYCNGRTPMRTRLVM